MSTLLRCSVRSRRDTAVLYPMLLFSFEVKHT